MAQLNDTNYANQVPLEDDYVIFVRDSDGVLKTATMTQLATLFQSIANLNLTVSVVSIDTVLSDQQLMIANLASAIQFTLPAASLNTGRGYRIFNRGAGALTVLPNGADTIAGNASVVLAQYGSTTVYSDGLSMWTTF